MRSTDRLASCWCLLLGGLLFGCAAPSALSIQISSDLTPPRDVDELEVVVTRDGAEIERETAALTAGSSLGRARRVLQLEGIAAGTYDVVVTLSRQGERVVSRDARVRVEGTTVRTLLLTRACAGVTCGTDETCDLGRCVLRECSVESPELCGAPLCSAVTDCPSTVGCAPASCSATGACAAIPDDDACTSDAPVCDATLGCLPASSPGGLVLTAEATPGARTVFIDVEAPLATRVYAGVSPTALTSPGVDEIFALGHCATTGTGMHCGVASLEPETTYYAYAIAERELATGSQVSNVFEEVVTTLAEVEVVGFTSNGGPAEAVVWIPDAARDAEPGELFPTILFLHGGWEATHPIASFTTDGEGLILSLIVDRELSRDFPFIVVAPHCYEPVDACRGWRDLPRRAATTLAIDALDAVAAAHPIDTSRVYITGLSYGGEGTFVVAIAHPERFAAAIPIASTRTGGVPADICNMAGIAVWAAHNPADDIAAFVGSENYLAAHSACASASPSHLSVLDCDSVRSGEHCGWNEMYDGTHGDTFEGQTSVFDWLLMHTLP